MVAGGKGEVEMGQGTMHIAHLSIIIWHFTQKFQLVLSVSFQ
jgi:hypothetical protein